MRLHSYVVARDYGFAPNPFYGVCTLCTCKPIIRRVAQIGDWIVGTGSGSARPRRDGYLVYAMKVDEALTFEDYWNDPRFASKRPYLYGSKKQAFGDNIYSRDRRSGNWVQADSHHSNPDGTQNQNNISNDTQTNRVLVGREFVYFGGHGPKIPEIFRDYEGRDVCCIRGHKNDFPDDMIRDFLTWIDTLGKGNKGAPIDWKKA